MGRIQPDQPRIQRYVKQSSIREGNISFSAFVQSLRTIDKYDYLNIVNLLKFIMLN